MPDPGTTIHEARKTAVSASFFQIFLLEDPLENAVATQNIGVDGG